MPEALERAAPEAAVPAPRPVDRPGGAPLCFVVDEAPSMRHFLSLVLHGCGIDTEEFADGEALRSALGAHKPDLVFHDISLESADAIDSVLTLGKAGFRGPIQLMSNRGAAVLDHVKTVGLQHKLQMLPALKKPFETDAVTRIIAELKIGTPQGGGSGISLAEALSNNWIEFWLQPKIDLRRKQLAGVEAVARARHPQGGIVLPDAFTPQASEPDLERLAELAMVNAIKASGRFSALGLQLQVAINMPLQALVKLPVADLVKAHRPSDEKWPGLIIDLAEQQIINDLPLAIELSTQLAPSNVKLALDAFGRAYTALASTETLPFAELKLDRAFVIDCATSKINAPVCKSVIDLAHNFGAVAVAVGIEKASDAIALVSMGCDYGQGFLLGQPMPEERFLSLLRQRTGAARKAPAA